MLGCSAGGRSALPPPFRRAMEEAELATLEERVHDWPLSGCAVTLTRVCFLSPVSTSTDFRLVTPLVLTAVLPRAGVRVLEPCERITLTCRRTPSARP